MAVGGYVGINNIAKKIKEIYVGIDNRPRKVVKAYIGVNGVTKLWWQLAKIILVFKPKETRKDSGYTDYQYTIQKNGCYLIMYWNSTLNIDVTVPSRPILINGKVYDSWNPPVPHLHYYLMNLQQGDVITYRIHGSNTSDAINRPMCMATVFLLDGITINSASVCATRDVQDGTINYNVPNDNNKHLVFGFVQGDYISDSTNVSVKQCDAYNRNVPNNLGRIVGSVYYGNYSNMPTITFSCNSWGRSQLVDLIVGSGGNS